MSRHWFLFVFVLFVVVLFCFVCCCFVLFCLCVFCFVCLDPTGKIKEFDEMIPRRSGQSEKKWTSA